MKNNTTRIFFKEIRNFKFLSKKEEAEMFKAYRETGSRRAHDAILSANYKFVAKMAFFYHGHSGHDLDDLIGAGCMGMTEAMEEFDYTKNVKFFSWAVWLIRARMLTEIAEQGSFVKVHGSEKNRKLKLEKAGVKLAQKLGREPTRLELAEETGIKAEHVGHMREVLNPQASLDQTMFKDDTLHEFLADDSEPEETDELSVTVNRLISMSAMSELEADTVRMYFGIGYPEACTLAEIGEKHGRSREGIRIIKKRAMRKLEKYNDAQKMAQKPHLTREMI